MSDRQLNPAAAWEFRCPKCKPGDLNVSTDVATCRKCRSSYRRSSGIWGFLPDDRAAYYRDFLDRYTRIRHAEGRDGDADYYRALPACQREHPVAGQWDIRRKSFSALNIMLGNAVNPGSRVLDIGAGVGWLSNRLAASGYRPCAVDLSVDDQDGLGASRHYECGWPLLQAEFDNLPLADNQADVLIFNASFHYSTDFPRTLKEACRVVVPGGSIVILDTPVYRDKHSGRQMLEEQKTDFEQRFADRSDALAHEGFLTWDAIDRLGEQLKLSWSISRPSYGLKWAMRPLIARFRGGREPATFAILHAVTRK